MPVPNTNTFSLQDVANVVDIWDYYTLNNAFDYAIASRFDPRYEGNKDRLSNFRNYGYTGNLTYKSRLSITYTVDYWDSSDNYIYYVNSSERIIYVYSVDASGVISYVGYGDMNAYTERPGPLHVIEDNFMISIFFDSSYPDKAMIWSFGYDALSNSFATYQRLIHNYNSDPDWQQEDVTRLTVNESDKFFFFSHNYYVDYSGYIYIYSYETSSYQTTWKHTQYLGYGISQILWQNGYLHVLGAYSGGYTGTSLRSYSLNTSTGVLTLVNTITVSTTIRVFGMTGNGTDLIFLNKGYYHYCYLVTSSGYYSLRDTDSILNGQGNSVIFKESVNSAIFINTYGEYIYSKRTNGYDDFVTEDSEDYGGRTFSTMRSLLNHKGKPWILMEGISGNELLCYEVE